MEGGLQFNIHDAEDFEMIEVMTSSKKLFLGLESSSSKKTFVTHVLIYVHT
jgi:hypothetical protein